MHEQIVQTFYTSDEKMMQAEIERLRYRLRSALAALEQISKLEDGAYSDTLWASLEAARAIARKQLCEP